MNKIMLLMSLLFFCQQHKLDAKNWPPFILLEQVCCHLFGNEKVVPIDKQLFDEAYDNFGLSHSDNIYYIDAELPKNFSSFTWFGTWIDKETWMNMPPNLRTFAAHHEVAHTYACHPLKQILLCLTTATITSLVSSKLIGRIINFYIQPGILNAILKCELTGSFTIMITLLVANAYAQYGEKQADLLASHILCNHNQRNVVEEYLKELEKICPPQQVKRSWWFYPVNYQIRYIRQFLNTLNDI